MTQTTAGGWSLCSTFGSYTCGCCISPALATAARHDRGPNHRNVCRMQPLHAGRGNAIQMLSFRRPLVAPFTVSWTGGAEGSILYLMCLCYSWCCWQVAPHLE
jgi:hypothetical protein